MAVTLAFWCLTYGLLPAGDFNLSPAQVAATMPLQFPATPEVVAARIRDAAQQSAIIDRQDAAVQVEIDQLVRDVECLHKSSQQTAAEMLRLREYSAFLDVVFRLHLRANKAVLSTTGLWLPMPAIYFVPVAPPVKK